MTKNMEIIKGRLSPEYWYGLKLTIALISLFLSLFVFSAVSYDFSDIGFLYHSDHWVHLIVGEVVTPSITIMMKGITFLGSKEFIWGTAALIFVYLLLKKEWWYIFPLVMSIGGTETIMSFLKEFFHRPRPMPQIVPAAGYSFPSGHAFYAMLVYGFMIYLAWKFIRNSGLRRLIFILCPLLILLIGLSRIYLGVHWLTDVLGGYCAGYSWLLINILVVRIIRHYWEGEEVRN
jgi:undecaprenyl-diphosphatase